MERSVESIFLAALELVRNDPTISGLAAIQRCTVGLGDDVRKHAVAIFSDAACHAAVGSGTNYQESILERAFDEARKGSRSQEMRRDKQQRKMPAASGERKENMSETKATKTKKYNVGDKHNTVGTMGLQVTDDGRSATCPYQFSRKTGREGTMDLPSGTEVLYVGARAVYEGQASTKRMIFKALAGTKVLLNGQETTLDKDIEIAGVVNHIDADDPYNVQARENEAKRAEKARIKAAAQAAKTQAA